MGRPAHPAPAASRQPEPAGFGRYDSLGPLDAERRSRAAAGGQAGPAHNTLFKLLLRQAPYCDTEANLLDVAEGINRDFDPLLPRDEVEKTALSAWCYEVRGKNWAGRQGRVILTGPEIDALVPYPDASHLLLILRRAHGAGREPFAASPRAMASSQVIPGWQHGRYRSALRRLVNLGLLRAAPGGTRGWPETR